MNDEIIIGAKTKVYHQDKSSTLNKVVDSNG